MIVADTSALVDALAVRPTNPRLVTRLLAEPELHVPYLIDVEYLHAVRGLLRRGELSEERATYARWDFELLRLQRYPHQAFADRIWALRDNLSAYDAAFVALAEGLDARLVTADARLARAPVHEAEVEVYEAED